MESLFIASVLLSFDHEGDEEGEAEEDAGAGVWP